MNPLQDGVNLTRVLARAGVLQPVRPDRALRMASAARHWGVSLASTFAVPAARFGERTAIVDERGALSYDELDRRTDAQARGLLELGMQSGDVAGILCRNHRYILEATGALAKIGVHTLYLNTGFSAPQLREVFAREQGALLVHDEEFDDLARAAGIDRRVVAWYDHADPAHPSLDELARRNAGAPRPPRPTVDSHTIILTSGTTGTPKGASRRTADSAGPMVALLERIPYRAGETMVVAAPIFHSWGFSNALVGLLLGDTLVLERRFDAEHVLAAIAERRADALVAVPVMLMRMLELPDDVRRAYDVSSLRIVPLSGSSLPGDLATRFMDAFGDVLYNLYGSTEVGYVTIATPADLRRAPSTAGRPPRGAEIRLLDDDDHEVGPRATGRIFVRSGLLFEGYTDGRSKRVLDGFMQTGDTGHVDDDGLLFVDGRDDDMIVSGGENVFPSEVEDVISRHPAVAEAAVVGVPDDEWGQRLKAYVVARDGRALQADEIRTYVRDQLARYKVPRDVEIVTELPRNATGKVVRRDLT